MPGPLVAYGLGATVDSGELYVSPVAVFTSLAASNEQGSEGAVVDQARGAASISKAVAIVNGLEKPDMRKHPLPVSIDGPGEMMPIVVCA